MILDTEEYATHLWEYDDGHDYHYIYTDSDTAPTKTELVRRFGTVAKGWRLVNHQPLTDEY